MCEVQHISGRGRGLVANRLIKAGEDIVVEAPILLTVAPQEQHSTCALCMRLVDRACCQPCSSCQAVVFCSPECTAAAAQQLWLHAPETCRAYGAMQQLLPGALAAQGQLRFLIQAMALRHLATTAADGRYEQLLGLVGEPDAAMLQQAAALQAPLAAALGGSAVAGVEELAALLIKEQRNSYGIIMPVQHQQQQPQHTRHKQRSSSSSPLPGHTSSSDDGPAAAEDGERAVRGGGIYPHCALVNHECIPNVVRMDSFDFVPAQWPLGTEPTAVVLRAMHDLPAGTELVQSYFPLNWSYADRQEQAQQVYGFTCACPRCQLEQQDGWAAEQEGGSSSGEWETDEEQLEDEDMDDSAEELQGEPGDAAGAADAAGEEAAAGAGGVACGAGGSSSEAMTSTYLSLFLLKYVCPAEGCFGTMAALAGSDACQCNVCGRLRTDAEFLASL